MHIVKLYSTPAGSRPLYKFISELTKKHKDDNILKIKLMLEEFEKYGFELNKKYPNSIKFIRDDIYELRPTPSRVFFFHHTNGEFILLHGFEKKTNTTPKNEIELAEKEKNDYIKRWKNGEINNNK